MFTINEQMHAMSKTIPIATLSLLISFKIIIAILAIMPTIEKIIPSVYSFIFFIDDAPIIYIFMQAWKPATTRVNSLLCR